jgi:hypothetical protein
LVLLGILGSKLIVQFACIAKNHVRQGNLLISPVPTFFASGKIQNLAMGSAGTNWSFKWEIHGKILENTLLNEGF